MDIQREYTKRHTMYASNGAISFNPMKEGIYVNAAKSLDPNQRGFVEKGSKKYNWENGVGIMLNQKDLFELSGIATVLIHTGRVPKANSIIHEYRGVQKKIQINANNNGTFLIIAIKGENDSSFKTFTSVQLGLGNLMFLSSLANFAMSLFDWEYDKLYSIDEANQNAGNSPSDSTNQQQPANDDPWGNTSDNVDELPF